MIQQDWALGAEHEDSLALQLQSDLQERGSDMWGGRQRTTFSLLHLATYTRHWGQDSTPPRPEKTKSTLSCHRLDLTKAVSGTFLTFTWKTNKCLFQGLLKRVQRFWCRGCLGVPEEAQRTKDLVKRETSRHFIQLLPVPKTDRFQAEVNKYLRIWATLHSFLFKGPRFRLCWKYHSQSSTRWWWLLRFPCHCKKYFKSLGKRYTNVMCCCCCWLPICLYI